MASEGAAISLLTRAVELDQKKRYTEALVCYKEGMAIIMEVLKGIDQKKIKGLLKKKVNGHSSFILILQGERKLGAHFWIIS